MKNGLSTATLVLILSGCASQSNFPRSIDPTPINFCLNSQDNTRWQLPENSWKDAFIASALGQKDAAIVFATGGASRFEYDYSIQGHIIKIERNDVGIIRVKDTHDKCDLTPTGYENLKKNVR